MAKPRTVTSIYLSPGDRAALEEAAKKAGLPLTTYIKKQALKRRKRAA